MKFVLAIASLITACAYVGIAYQHGITRFSGWTDAQGKQHPGGGRYVFVAFMWLVMGSLWLFLHR